LCYFAGGDALDIALVHGVSRSEVFRSVWIVVDAINDTPDFDIRFPADHDEQRSIASMFQTVSSAGFDCCVGAIDGILIWITRPPEEFCDEIKCGAQKFLCGRKKKFGMNMQATCDARYRFLDVAMLHPGATSDYLAFITSPLFHQLKQPGFLADGLCLFGDNAYVTDTFMVTPYPNVGEGDRFHFNYYQSQLRIRIEMAFGMLVHRWAILRKPMPYQITVPKTCALVYALCKLHNFCIDENEEEIVESSAQDQFTLSLSGGIPLDASQDGFLRPSELLDGPYNSDGA